MEREHKSFGFETIQTYTQLKHLKKYITSPPLSIQSTALLQTCTQRGHFCFSGLSLSRCLQCSPLKKSSQTLWHQYHLGLKLVEWMTFGYEEHKLKKKSYQKQTCCCHRRQLNGDIWEQVEFQWWRLCKGQQINHIAQPILQPIHLNWSFILYIYRFYIAAILPTPWAVLHIKA